jgi:CRP-like cAMP-binding protein
MDRGVLPRLRRVFGAPRPNGRLLLNPALYKREYLREVDIFRDLTQADLAELDAATRMTTVLRGRTIYHQEDTAEGLFILKRGRVRLFRIGPGGKKLDLAVLEPGTFFGEMPLLGERMRNASAEALEDCTLCVMSQTDVERLVLGKPRVALRMLQTMGRRLAAAEARLEDLAYRSVRARLASLLLRLERDTFGARSGRGGVLEGVTHQDLGDMVGAYRETVTKLLDDFQAEGLVELARRRVRVLRRDGLTALLEE